MSQFAPMNGRFCPLIDDRTGASGAARLGRLWMDPGAPGNEKILPIAPKLVKIDLATNQVVKVVSVAPDIALQGIAKR